MANRGRPKREDMRAVSCRLSEDTIELIDRFCDETGLPKSTAMDKILKTFLTEFFNQPEAERTLFKV